jgi:ActR/RegA family two-component response regulator
MGLSVQELPLILVIEDDPDIQIIVEDALSEGGFEPAIAASGEEAVTLLRGGFFKLERSNDANFVSVHFLHAAHDFRVFGCQFQGSRSSRRLIG